MIKSKKSRLHFSLGVGAIALGYSLWMYVNTYLPKQMPITLPPTIAAPIGAAAVAALCWYVVVEKFNLHGRFVGFLIGIIAGWSIFVSGLLGVFATGILSEGESFRTIEALIVQAKLALGIGPLFLIMAWGWVPLLLCAFWGYWIQLRIIHETR